MLGRNQARSVMECEQDQFFKFSEEFHDVYKSACPFPTRPVREISFDTDQPNLAKYRNSWNGTWESTVMIKRGKMSKRRNAERQLTALYDEKLAIKQAKYKDLQ